MFGYYTALLAAMAMCFLGIGMLISALARSTDVAQGAAFVVWLTLLLFLDLILLGVMIQGKVSPEVAVTSRWPTRCRSSAPPRWPCSTRS
jgi:ABC-2 type transport system permease protein